MSIGNYENLVSNAIRRAVRLGEPVAVPRVSDLPFLTASTAGRVEIEAIDEGKEEQVLSRIQRSAINAVFGRYFTSGQFEWLVQRFEEGTTLETGEGVPASAYVAVLRDPSEIATATRRLGLPEKAEAIASTLEFVLEGLHLNKRLNKDELDGKSLYRR
jgi:magnesium chelatase subunit I